MSFHSLFKGNQSKNRMDPEIASQLFPIRQSPADREKQHEIQKTLIKTPPLVEKILATPPEAPPKGSMVNVVIAILMIALIAGVIVVAYVKKVGPFAETSISQ